ncbi:ABC transporter permease subunit [Paenibacillus amylolyticus]|nr:ABC transporter permease subunit [Paenibacillus amylolyticus]
MVLIPIVQMINALHIPTNQYTPIFMFITCSLPFSTFLYTGFIRSGVPEEVEEAAHIDGAGLFQRFWTVVFPLLIPVTVSGHYYARCLDMERLFLQYDLYFQRRRFTVTAGHAQIFGRSAKSHAVECPVCSVLSVRATVAAGVSVPAKIFYRWYDRWGGQRIRRTLQ